MVKIDMTYRGELRVSATHGPSGTSLHTDAPVDNCGKGESFSPTDLIATGLGSCMATTMGIYAEKNQIDLKGMEVEVIKQMSQEGPRRIAGLKVDIRVPKVPDAATQKMLEGIAENCPVAKSLHPDLKVDLQFQWGKQR